MIVDDVLKILSERTLMSMNRLIGLCQTSNDAAVRAAYFEWKANKGVSEAIVKQLKKERE